MFNQKKCYLTPSDKRIKCYVKELKGWSKKIFRHCAENTGCEIAFTAAPIKRRNLFKPAQELLVLANQEITVSCIQGAQTSDGSTTLAVEEGLFQAPVKNRLDEQEIKVTQQALDRLAEYFGMLQISCFAASEEVSAVCPVNADTLFENAPNLQSAGSSKVKITYHVVLAKEELILLNATNGDYAYVVNNSDWFHLNGNPTLQQNWGQVDTNLANTALFNKARVNANNAALLKAIQLSKCGYYNDEVVVNCPSTTDGLTPSQTAGVAAVTVAPGIVRYNMVWNGDTTSPAFSPTEVYPDTLNKIAKSQALLSLNCVYCSSSIKKTCESVTLSDGVHAPVGASEITIPTCEFSEIWIPSEQDDPDNLVLPPNITASQLNATASAYADSVLRCLYGNNPVEVTCPNDTVSVLCDPSTTNRNVYKRYANWRYDAQGNATTLDPVLVCDEEKGAHYVLVDTFEETFLDAFYDNTTPTSNRIDALNECDPTNSVEEVLSSTISDFCGNPVAPPEGGWPVDSNLSVETSVERNFFVTPTDSQTDAAAAAAAAQVFALDYALATSICLWGNEEVPSLSCPNSTRSEAGYPLYQTWDATKRDSRKICASEFTSSLSKLDAQRLAWQAAYASQICSTKVETNDEIQLACDAQANVAASVVPKVEAGQFSGIDKYESDLQAISFACALKRCVFLNDYTIDNICPNLQIPIVTGTVPAGLIQSYESKEAANSEAEVLAEALKICPQQFSFTENKCGITCSDDSDCTTNQSSGNTCTECSNGMCGPPIYDSISAYISATISSEAKAAQIRLTIQEGANTYLVVIGDVRSAEQIYPPVV